jgi:hypothetical protein
MKCILVIVLILLPCLAAHAQNGAGGCPRIELSVPKLLPPGSPVFFNAKVGEFEGSAGLQYFWIIRGGAILKGEGTARLQFVASDNNNGLTLPVAVKVSGLPDGCPDTVSEFVQVASLPIGEPVDAFGELPLDDFKGRLDTFRAEIRSQGGADSEGLIQLVFDAGRRRSGKLFLLKEILAFLDFRKFDKTRVTFAISEGGGRRTVLWIVPQGAKFPEYNSSGAPISGAKSQIFKAEELKKKIDDVCLKNGPR